MCFPLFLQNHLDISIQSKKSPRKVKNAPKTLLTSYLKLDLIHQELLLRIKEEKLKNYVIKETP